MIRHKGFVSILLAAITSLVVFIATGVSIANKNSQAFAGDGYILAAESVPAGSGGAEAMTEPEPLYFSAGTRYRGRYPESLVFTDVQGSQRAVDYYSFVHYADDSVSALSDGVLVNMDDINTGLVNHYGLRSGVVMVANGGGYTVENNGNQMNFHNFFWKLSDSHFLLRSDNLLLTLPDGTQETVDGFLEAQYIEEGVVQLTDKSHRWQVVSDGTAVAMSNGINYDFGDKVVRDADGMNRMAFQELLLDADDNIQVQSAEEWVAPQFDFEVIDGQEGQDGEAGEEGVSGQEGQSGNSGQSGQDGEDGDEGGAGDDGEAGNEGTHGRAGTAGKTGTSGANAASGEQGAQGTLTDKEAQAQAAFNITDFELTAGSLQVTFAVTDEDAVLKTSGSVKLLDPQGNEIKDWIAAEGALVSDNNGSLEFYGDTSYTITWDNLNPDTQYRLIVSSDYELKKVTGQRDYINRTFYTDSTGMQLEKVYATPDSFGMILTRKTFSEATGAVITILDGSNNEMMSCTVSAGDFDSDGTVELNTDDGFTVEKELSSNTSYVIKLESIVNGTPNDSGNRQTWKTLKKTPSLGEASAYPNSQTFFNMMVSDVVDDDGAITEYRYDVYLAGGSEPLKTISSKDNKQVALYIDDVITRNVFYQLRVTALYYDNEKNAELRTEYSKVFTMGDAGGLSLSFEWAADANRQTELEGTLRIAPKDAGDIGVTPDKPLTVQVESSGNYLRTLTFSKADMDTHLEDGVYNIPLHLFGLKASSSYRISVWGYVLDDPAEKTYVYQLVGDYVVNTISHSKILVDIETANNGSTVGCYIYLGPATDNSDPEDYDISLKSIRAVEVKLYTGSTASEGNLVATAVAVDDADSPNNPYQNKIASTYYGAKGRQENNRIYVDEANFLRTAGDLTASQYCMEVSAVYDYTYHYTYDYNERQSVYYNTLPFDEKSNRFEPINVNTRLPDFPTPADSAVIATPILFENLKNDKAYEDVYNSMTASEKAQYLDETIVGYHLQARFDNSSALAKTVTYYALTQTDLNLYKKDTNTDKGDDVMAWRKKLGSSVTRPWMQVTLPVAADATNLTSMSVLFMEPPAGGTNVSAINNLLDAEAAENTTASISGIHDTYIAGTTPIFFARDLERGWHYLFSYTARLDYQGQSSYKYPNNYTGKFIDGQTLLYSGVMDTPRQPADVKMYLYKTDNGSDAKSGVADWKYQYTNLDGAAELDFDAITNIDELKKVFTIGAGSAGVLTDTGSLGTEAAGFKQLRVSITGNMEYIIQMKQKYYDDNSQYNSNEDTVGTENLELTRYQFTVPMTKTTVETGVTVKLVPPDTGNTAQFTFDFGSTGMENRLERIVIWADNGSGGVVTGSSQTYTGFTGTNTSNLKYIGYDLSRAGGINQTVKFRVGIYYDSGYGGNFYVANALADDRFAVQTSTGHYVVKRWVSNGLGGYNFSNVKNNSSAWYSSYKVSPATSNTTAATDEAWEIVNSHSAITNDPSYAQPILNLRYTKNGAYDVVDAMYPIFKRVDYVKFGDGDTLTHEIKDLTPSVNYTWLTSGLTTLKGSISTNSFHLIKETTPTKDAQPYPAGKYIHVSLYRYYGDDPSGSYDPTPAWHDYVAITSEDVATTYSFLAEGLAAGGCYRVELTCEQSSGEKLLWDTSRDEVTVYTAQLMKSMDITDMAFTDIVYESYKIKYTTLKYTLQITEGFEIQYSLEKMEPGGSYEHLANHGDIMKAMGYEQNLEGEWGKKSSDDTFIPWKIMASMMETISLSPGGLFAPGNSYRLTVKAVDTSNAVVGTNSAEFTWPVLSKPDFYITTEPSSSGKSFDVKLDPIDINKVIVDGVYYVVVWDEETIKHFEELNVKDGLKMKIPINELEANSSYTLAIYARTDMENANAMGPLELDQAKLAIMSPAERAQYLIYQSTERTMEAWGGRYDSFNIRFNNSNNIRIDMFNAYNLENIDEIRATVYKDGKSNNFTMKRPSNQTTLFSKIGTSETDFYTVLTTNGVLTESGVYSITCSFMKDDQELFRETKSAVID